MNENEKLNEGLLEAFDASLEIVNLLGKKFGGKEFVIAASNSITATLITLNGLIDNVEKVCGSPGLRQIVAKAIAENGSLDENDYYNLN